VLFDPIGTLKGLANSAIRGLRTERSIPSIDSTVGMFVDDVSISVNPGAVFDALERPPIPAKIGKALPAYPWKDRSMWPSGEEMVLTALI